MASYLDNINRLQELERERIQRALGATSTPTPVYGPVADYASANKKNKGGFIGGVGYVAEKIAAGLVSSIEGIWDFAAGGLADLFGADRWAEKQIANDWFGDWYDTAGSWYNAGNGMQTVGDIASGIGTSIPALVTSIAGTFVGAPWLGAALTFGVASTSAGGGAVREAYKESGNLTGKEWGYAALSGSTEGLLETATNAIGMGTGAIVKSFGKNAAKNVAKQGLIKSAAITAGKSFSGEAFEEGMSAILNPQYAKLTYNPDAQNATAQEILYSAFVGGMAGVVMGEANLIGTEVGNYNSAKKIIENKTDHEVFTLAEALIARDDTDPIDTDVMKDVRGAYKQLTESLKHTDGNYVDGRQIQLLGRLNALTAAATLNEATVASAAHALNNAEAVAESLNALGYVDANGNKITYTADQIRDGFKADGAGKRFAVQKAIKNNPILRAIASTDAASHLLMDTNAFEAQAMSGRRVQSQKELNDYIEQAPESVKNELARTLGIDNWNTLNYTEFNAKLDAFLGNAEGRKMFESRMAKKIAFESERKAKSHIVKKASAYAARKDGIRKYKVNGIEFAVEKSGEEYTLYDYTDKAISKPMSLTELREKLSEYDAKNAQKGAQKASPASEPTPDTNKDKTDEKPNESAEKEKTATKKEAGEKSNVARSYEIAKKRVLKYKDLSANDQSMVRKIIRQGLALGVREDVIVYAANIAARTHTDAVFNKGMCAVPTEDGKYIRGYANGAYVASEKRFYFNPEAQTTDGFIIHELDHALRKRVGKDGAVTTKIYRDAIVAAGQDTYEDVAKRYEIKRDAVKPGDKFTLDGTRLDEKVNKLEDEVEAFYAETVLKDKDVLKYLLAEKPTIKQRIINFFKGAVADYASLPQLDADAKKYFKQYEKWFAEFEKDQRGTQINMRFGGARGDVRYSLPYESAIDSLKDGTLDTEKNTHLKVLEHTPQIYIEKADAADREIVIGWDIAYLAMNKSGTIPGHYHGLGADVMKALPPALEDPLYIVKQNSGRIAAVTKIVVKGKRAVFASIELETFKTTIQDGEPESKVYNLVVTVTDAKPNYLQNTIFSGDIVYNKNSEDPAHFILRLKSLEKAVPTYDLAGSSKDSIPETSTKSNPSDEKSSKTSEKDSEGHDLTQEQAEYFKDSKERDKDGNLRVMYQGAAEDFSVFDRKKSKPSNLYGRGFYFTDSITNANLYGSARAFYLNITNPLSLDKRTITRVQMRKFLNAVAENEDYGLENYGTSDVGKVLASVYSGKSDFAMIQDVNATCIGDLVAAVELFNEINGTEYDGFILDTESVTFRSNQAKLVSNKTPTSNPDISYSLPNNDSEYMDAVNRGDMETAQKMVDEVAKEAGVLIDSETNQPLHLYHGGNADITVFDGKKGINGKLANRSITYFSPYREVANSYKGKGSNRAIYDCYLVLNNPLVITSNDYTKVASLNDDKVHELELQGYDGVIFYPDERSLASGWMTRDNTEYVAFKSAQIKSADPVTYDDSGNVIPLSKRFDPRNSDIRYSLPIGTESIDVEVEETGDLLAIHNLTEQNLLDTLDLGGFPMPSIAVIRKGQEHSNYGNISIVFGRDTIDPERYADNKVYGSDAWTPTSSQARTEYPVDSKKVLAFESKMKELGRKVADGTFATTSMIRRLGIDRVSEQNAEKIAERLAYKDEARAAYLAEQGKDIEPVYKKKVYNAFGNEALQKYIDTVGAQHLATVIADSAVNGDEALQSESETVRKIIRETYSKKHEAFLKKHPERMDEFMEKNVTRFTVEDFVNDAWQYHEEGGSTTEEVDRLATSEKLRETVSEKDVKAWLLPQVEDFLGEPGIYNGKDPFTPAGRSRSFAELHYAYTAENIVKAMKSGTARGVNTFGANANAIIATATPSYKSVAEIKSDKARLKTVEAEKYQKLLSDIEASIKEVEDDILRTTKHYSDNSFEERESIGYAIMQAAATSRTAVAIQRSFAKEGYSITLAQAKKVLELYEQASKMPTGYFEAKPERVVNFSEIKMVELPESASETLRRRLSEHGIPYEIYGNSDIDRFNAIQNLSDVSFSLPDNDSEYMDAVNRGDMETAQKMVDEAAKKAGYTVKGLHATNAEFTVFDINKTSSENFHGKGIYFTNSVRDVENNYENYEGPDPWQKIEGRAYELVYDKYGISYEDTLTSDSEIIDKLNECYDIAIDEFTKSVRRITAYLRFDNPLILEKRMQIPYKNYAGYDGIVDKQVYENIGHSGMDENTIHYVVFNPKNIKSAAPVTYDDSGNVIPLSKRFDASNPDIRFSLPDTDGTPILDENGKPIPYESYVDQGVPYARGTDMSVGEMRKQIANTTHYKVFSKNRILEDVKNFPMGDLLKAETREKIADSIWQSFNSFTSAEEVDAYIHDMARYILSASMREAKVAREASEDAQRRFSSMHPYVQGLTFTKSELEDIRTVRGADGLKKVLGRWGFKTRKDGKNHRTPMDVFVTDMAREVGEFGNLEDMNPVDAFLALDEAYEKAKKDVNDKWQSAYEDVTDADLESLLALIEIDLRTAYEDLGDKSKFFNTFEPRLKRAKERADKWKAAYDKQNRYTRLAGIVEYKAKELKDLKKHKFANATQIHQDTLDASIGKLSNVLYKGILSVGKTRKACVELLMLYRSDDFKKSVLLYKDDNDPGLYNGMIETYLEVLADGNMNLLKSLNMFEGVDEEYRQSVNKARGFTAHELKLMEGVLSYFIQFYKNYGKVYHRGKMVDIDPLAREFVGIAQGNQSLKKNLLLRTVAGRWYADMFMDAASLMRMADGYLDGFNTTMLEDLREAKIKATIEEMRVMKQYDEFVEKNKKYMSEESKKTVTVRDATMTKAVLLDLYCTTFRKQAWEGLAFNGFTFVDAKGDTVRVHGNLDENSEYSEKEIEEEVVRLRNEVEQHLTEKDREYIKIVEHIYNVESKRIKMNRDIERFGFSNVEEGYYYPIKRGDIAKNIDKAPVMEELDRVSNASFNKDIVKHARQKLVLEPVDSRLRRHVTAVCQYAHASATVEAFNRLYNYDISGRPNDPVSVKTQMENVWKNMDQYWRKLIGDVQGVNTRIEGENVFSYIRGGYAVSLLSANPKVWVTQLSSFAAASGMIDIDSIAKGLVVASKEDIENIGRYCPLAEIRRYENTAALAQGVLDRRGVQMGKGGRAMQATRKIGELGMKPIEKMDTFVINRLFGACMLEVAKNNGPKVKTEENKIAAGKLLTKLILETQQNAMATERSAAMRSSNEILRTATMFSSDAMKVVGRFIDGWGEVRVLKQRISAEQDADTKAEYENKLKLAKKKFKKALGALLLSSAYMAGIAALFKLLYNKWDKEWEEDEDKALTITKSMTADFLGNMLGGLPVLRDAYTSLVEGYDVDNYAYSAINDFLTSAKSLKNLVDKDTTSEDIAKALKDLAYNTSSITGLPVRNVYNTLYGVTKRLSEPTAHKIDSVFYAQNYESDLNKYLDEGDSKMVEYTISLLYGGDSSTLSESTFDELRSLAELGYKVTPRKVSKKITVDGVEYPISDAESAQIRTKYFEYLESLDRLTASEAYKKLTDEQRYYAVDQIIDAYYDKSVSDVMGTKGSKRSMLTCIGGENIAIGSALLKDLTDDVNKKGEKISGSKRKKVVAAINTMPITAEQKILIMYVKGYVPKDGDIRGVSAESAKNKLLNMIVKSNALTKEQKASLAQSCGFTVKNGKIMQ